jgi:redox-sensitive bicupin YhaK (pirin superfamily)
MSRALLLQGHEKDLGGGFRVRRLLPAAQRQSVGPFLFFDHFGPTPVAPADHHDVRPHPHIGLATVTYLFEGAILHRDSLGSEQRIAPGAINWMTAGRGIVHSERRPADLAERHYVLHGIQLWAALPLAQEEAAPAFSHTAAEHIPVVRRDGVELRLLIGSAFGQHSPVATFSETLYLDLALATEARFMLPALAPEMALYAVDGDLRVDDQLLPAHTLLVLESGASCKLSAQAPVRLLVIGGAPLAERRWMWWNFVSSRRERIVSAAQDWAAQRLGQVSGDSEFIPLPDNPFPSA